MIERLTGTVLSQESEGVVIAVAGVGFVVVDLQQNSQKLIERSKKIIMLATEKNYEEASHFLEISDGHVKSAILMAMTGLDLDKAKSLLDNNKGFIKKALFQWRDQNR